MTCVRSPSEVFYWIEEEEKRNPAEAAYGNFMMGGSLGGCVQVLDDVYGEVLHSGRSRVLFLIRNQLSFQAKAYFSMQLFCGSLSPIETNIFTMERRYFPTNSFLMGFPFADRRTARTCLEKILRKGMGYLVPWISQVMCRQM